MIFVRGCDGANAIDRSRANVETKARVSSRASHLPRRHERAATPRRAAESDASLPRIPSIVSGDRGVAGVAVDTLGPGLELVFRNAPLLCTAACVYRLSRAAEPGRSTPPTRRSAACAIAPPPTTSTPFTASRGMTHTRSQPRLELGEPACVETRDHETRRGGNAGSSSVPRRARRRRENRRVFVFVSDGPGRFRKETRKGFRSRARRRERRRERRSRSVRSSRACVRRRACAGTSASAHLCFRIL